MNKDKKLEQIRKNIEKTTDGMGMGIDSGIVDSVLYLNALGINTSQSCEGHIGWGLPGPWIDVRPNSKKFRFNQKQSTKLMDKAMEDEKKGVSQKIIDKIFIKRRKYAKIVDGYVFREYKKVLELLKLFYENRKTTFEVRLILANGRIQSQGLEVSTLENKKIQKENLIKYQKEMLDFTEFLKLRYFGK